MDKKLIQFVTIYRNKLVTSFILVTIFIAGYLLLLSVTGSQYLVHDEAVYLTKSRSWIENTPANEFDLFRPIGMAWFGWVFIHFTSSEIGLRTFGIIFGTLTLAFIFLLFKRISNIYIALVMVTLIASSSLFLQQAPLFLNDIPVSGFMVGIMWLIWSYLNSKTSNWKLCIVPLLVGIAFYTRYGAIVPLAVIALITLIIYRKIIILRFNLNTVWVAITFFLLLLVILPHLIESYRFNGNVLSLLIWSGAAAGRSYWGQGLVDYSKMTVTDIGGFVNYVSALTGIIITFVFTLIKRFRNNNSELIWLGWIGIVTLLVLGITTHAEARYIFFPLLLLSGAGVLGIFKLLNISSRIISKIYLLLIFLASICIGIQNYNNTLIYVKDKENNTSREAYYKASRAISDNKSNGSKCAIWAVYSLPEFSWYSRCNTVTIRDVASFQKDYLIQLRKDHFVVFYSSIREPQISKDNAKIYGVSLKEIYHSENLSSSLGELVIYKIVEVDPSIFKTHIKI